MALHVPDIGDFKDVAVIEILVAVGDTVTQEQSLITVESDKASMEIPSSHAGVLKALSVKIGDVVNIGDLIGAITVAGVAPAAPAVLQRHLPPPQRLPPRPRLPLSLR